MHIRLVVSLVLGLTVSPALALGPVSKHVGVGTPSPLDGDPPSTAIPPVPVAVQNFPAVQTIAGNVNVDNLPAVQQVAGSVDVANLPVAEDGSIRVSPPPGRQPVFFELLPAPIDLGNLLSLPTTVDTTGYSTVGIYAAASGTVHICPRWRWNDDEDFASVVDLRGNGSGNVSCFCDAGQRCLCNNVGGQLQIQLQPSSGLTGC
jgi:hypothetical protein